MKKQIYAFFAVATLCLVNLNISGANNNQSLTITEVGNHEISELEWIEFQNTSNANFELTDLIFKEQNINHKTALVQGSNILEPEKFALIVNNYEKFILKYPEYKGSDYTVLDSSWSSLSNDGEELLLIKNAQTIEQIISPANYEKTSMERQKDNKTYTNIWKPSPTQHSMFAENKINLTAEVETDQTNNENQEPENSLETEDEDTPLEIDSVIQEATTTEDIAEPDEAENVDSENSNSTEENIVYQEVITYIEKPFILISEISFNSSPDWIEIFIDPRKNEINLNNLDLEIDKKIINLGLTGKVTTPSLITVETDLVATTEQITINYLGKGYDSFCWNNQSPTASELIEQEILIQNQHWQSECLNSLGIKKDESFYRQSLLPDNNTKVDFKKTGKSTKGVINNSLDKSPKAVIEIQTGDATGIIPLSLNLDGSKSSDPENSELIYEWDYAGTKITKANPDSFKFENAGEYKVNLTVTDSENNSSSSSLMVIAKEKPTTSTSNSSLSNSTGKTVSLTASTIQDTPSKTSLEKVSKIELSAFFPNPKGADTNKEWIEIKNLETTQVNLSNYSLDDDEGGSKPYPLSGTIAPNETLRFTSDKTQLVLGNTEDKIRLLFNGQVIDEVLYSTAKDDDVFTKIDSVWQANGLTDSTQKEYDPNQEITPEDFVPNSVVFSAVVSDPAKTVTDFGDGIIITEVFPNPKGADTNKEWIELYNLGRPTYDLAGWSFKINGKTVKISEGKIKPSSYFVFKSEKLTLPNSSADIQLLGPSGNLIAQFQYDETFEDQSISSSQSGKGKIHTKNISPGQPNSLQLNLKGTISDINLSNQIITLTDEKNKKHLIYAEETLFTKLSLDDQVEFSVWQDYKNELSLDKIDSVTKAKKEESKQSKKILWTILIPMIAIPAIIYREKIKEIYIYLLNQYNR
jgi:hypothetical protein